MVAGMGCLAVGYLDSVVDFMNLPKSSLHREQMQYPIRVVPQRPSLGSAIHQLMRDPIPLGAHFPFN